jgi:GH15 family glucan-1,4-alpha-glucosidase
MEKQTVKKLVQVSKSVIQDCSLENGAIVAANSDKAAYPSTIQDYRYIWVRDAAYTCMAADLLGIRDVPERFFDWCLDRAEGFKETGLFCSAYNVNGAVCGTLIPPTDLKISRKAANTYLHIIHHGTQFQPDQSGALLIAIGHHIKHFDIHDISKFKKLIEKIASGISNSWKGNKFSLPYFDLWEERCIRPTQKRHHTYSLAVCIAGVRAALGLLGEKRNWRKTEKEMSRVFHDIYSSSVDSIPRTYSADKAAKNSQICKEDCLPDTSLLGLAYPAEILPPSDEKMKRTVEKIIAENTVNNGGVLRYPRDKYCGGVRNGWVTLTGAGPWPLLNFWMSVYYSLCNDNKNAKKYFTWPLERIDTYIPEQIFKDKKKSSVSPLVWAHSMFVIAAKFLGYL